jgi:hypothetical protein
MKALLLTGAYILLEDFAGAELHFNKLPEKEQKKITQFPIYKLWRTENSRKPVSFKKLNKDSVCAEIAHTLEDDRL